MSKPVSIKATKRSSPELRKLARALLMLAAQEQTTTKKVKPSPERKAS